eukprot:GHVP01029677.1.p1 GENE.GHVP01029677.1~~GHVP01029677.1.p1  ORF type:complete len:544 (+),score=90.56 GHVP01029677.1:44-1675(+)
MSAADIARRANVVGERKEKRDARVDNVRAVVSVANILRSSLGPQGLDKMIVDEVGDVVVSNDGATILKHIDNKHPAARVLFDVTEHQDQEVGDGTTSVVLLTAELLKRGLKLIELGIHPTVIIAGFKLASKEAATFLKSRYSSTSDSLSRDALLSIARTSLASKYISSDNDFFPNLVVDAVKNCKTINSVGDYQYPVKMIKILKTHGSSLMNSQLVDGFALSHTTRACAGMPTKVTNAKIAILDFPLRAFRMPLGVELNVDNPAELRNIRKQEKDFTKVTIEKILASGANVVVTSQGIDDMAMKYFVERGCLAVRRATDLQILARAVGATVCHSLVTMDGTENFEPSWLGSCQEVAEDTVGDWDYVFFRGVTNQRSSTVILRGVNDVTLDEVERSLHDAFCTVSKTLETNDICPGGGAVETALSVYLEDFALTLGSKEQLAVSEFGSSLLVIPKTLAQNAGLDSPELLGKLQTYHWKAQRHNQDEFASYGINFAKRNVSDNMAAGIVEPLKSKVCSIGVATEAAITILRIDDFIRAPKEQQQK